MVVQRLRLIGAICAANLVFSFLLNHSATAADGPNRMTRSDVSAGQLVDSLFDAEMPTPQKRSGTVRRKTSRRRAALRGQLVDNPNYRDGAPPYALVNREGQVLRYVKPVENIDLEMHIGEMVAVRRDTGRVLLASQLALPKNAQQTVAHQAAFEEPTPAEPIEAGEGDDAGEESVLTPTPEGEGEEASEAAIDDGPMIYDDGSYDTYAGELNFGGCNNCTDGSCSACSGGCAMPGRGVMYVHGQYLLWWMDGMEVPPLVIADDNGEFSSPDIIYGGGRILEDVRHGGRITAGLWLDECGLWGIEGDYLGLGTEEEVFRAGGNDGLFGPTGLYIGRPFFNTVEVDNGTVFIPRGPVQEEVDTDRLDGFVTVTTRSEFQSAGIRLRHGLCYAPGCCDPGCGDQVGCGTQVGCGSGVNCGSGCCLMNGPFGRLCRLFKCGCRRADVLYGFRWAGLNESLRIEEDLEVVGTSDPLLGTTFEVLDLFETQNDFYGGELGFMMQWAKNRWSLDVLSKVAIGNTRQRVDINGMTVVDGDNSDVGGLLTQLYEHPDGFVVGNIGSYQRDEFSMIPEIGATLGYCVTPRFRLTVGYTLLYWSNVVRPGEQIDLDVNAHLIPAVGGVDPDQVVPGDHPRFVFRQTDLWAHGLNFGGEYRW